jgi:hypothetical protein
VQGLRLEVVKAEYKGFVTKVRAEGEAAKKETDRVIAEDKLTKQKADDENKVTIEQLNANIVRLHNSRASRGYVPPSPTSSNRPDLACFDRGELERALQLFDEETTGLIAEGDQSSVNLNTVKLWAVRKP